MVVFVRVAGPCQAAVQFLEGLPTVAAVANNCGRANIASGGRW
jgi:hypothetical protein